MVTPESLLQLAFPSDPQVSPSGREVAFVLAEVAEEEPRQPDPDFARPRYRSHLWWSGGGAARQLTYGEAKAGAVTRRPAGRRTVSGSPLSATRARQNGP